MAKCVITNVGLKCWGKALYTLTMTGDSDIHFEFKKNCIQLTSYDSSYSVLATCTFNKEFFLSYEFPERENEESNDYTCRVPSKCIMKPFRSSKFITKSVNIAEIRFDRNSDSLHLEFKCRSGANINYLINLITETESYQVDFDEELLKNNLKADSKLILGSLLNFSHGKGVADITLKAYGNKIVFKNCMTDSKKSQKVYTELNLNPVDLIHYKLEEEAEITFPMKVFKIYAIFAETFKLPLSISFNQGSDPILVKIRDEHDLFEVALTMATKTVGDSSSQSSNASSTANSNQNINHISDSASSNERSQPFNNNRKRTIVNVIKDNNNTPSQNNFENTQDSARTNFQENQSAPPVKSPEYIASNSLLSDDIIERPVQVKIKSPKIKKKKKNKLINIPDYEAPESIPGFNDILVEDSDEEED